MECKFCGNRTLERPKIVYHDEDEDVRVFRLEFPCGSKYEFSKIGGKYHKFIWEDGCTLAVFIVKH